MNLPAILDPFVAGAAPAVMTRIALDWMIQHDTIDHLLEDVSQGQYSREFLLSHFVEVMADVACGFRKSPREAFLKRQFDQIASISAFYRKLNRMELVVTQALVRKTAERARELIAVGGGLGDEPIPGYAARILDGNILTGTDHRLSALRWTRSAALPGMSLAVYEPTSGLVRDIVLEENAHTQERALLDQVVVRPNELWIMDRNFCVRTFLFRILRSEAFFLVRRHQSTLPFEAIEPLRTCGRCATGAVSEQAIWVDDPEQEDRRYRLRRIVLVLDQPTRDGDTEIVLISNLPETVSAVTCCEAYRDRWKIESHFQRLTDLLHCEIPTMGYPRASLFAFSMSVVAGNAVAILLGRLRAEHEPVLVEELSHTALVRDIAEVYPGMMIAVPAPEWSFVSRSTLAEIVEMLRFLATRVPVERMQRSRRGPKKPRTTKKVSGGKIHHMATKKLLDRAKAMPPPADRGISQKRRKTK
jgi:IS4 transposase